MRQGSLEVHEGVDDMRMLLRVLALSLLFVLGCILFALILLVIGLFISPEIAGSAGLVAMIGLELFGLLLPCLAILLAVPVAFVLLWPRSPRLFPANTRGPVLALCALILAPPAVLLLDLAGIHLGLSGLTLLGVLATLPLGGVLAAYVLYWTGPRGTAIAQGEIGAQVETSTQGEQGPTP